MKKKNSKEYNYYQLNKSVLSLMNKKNLSATAVIIHALITDRTRYTNFKDEKGYYAIFTIEQLKAFFKKNTSKKTVVLAVNELIDLNLLTVVKTKGRPTKYYLKNDDEHIGKKQEENNDYTW